MTDPLTAEERVQYNVLQRKIEEAHQDRTTNLMRFVTDLFPHHIQGMVVNTLIARADTVISLLQPFATKEHK